MSGNSPPRRPLHERSDSHANTVRLVPATPPRLLTGRDNIYARTPLPTHPAHFLTPGGQTRGKDRDDTFALPFEFRRTSNAPDSTSASGSTSHTTHTTHQPPRSVQYGTGSPISKPKPIPKKRILHIHKDGQTDKTFSLVDQPPTAQETPTSPTLSTKSSFSLLSSNARNAGVRSNSITSCTSDASSVLPSTPTPEVKQAISADPIDNTNSPWNYQLVGGLRKVAKTPDLKQKVRLDSPLPPLPEFEDTAPGPSIVPQDLSTKQSFQSYSTETATTASDNTNYKVYHAYSDPDSDTALSPDSPETNYQILGLSSPAGSVIHRPQESSFEFENENYKVFPSPSASFVNVGPQSRYSHESLVVAPLKPRARRSNESFGYYKSRSRESLRTGSLTSISTILTEQEAARAIVGSGSLIQLPITVSKLQGSSWTSPLSSHPLRFLGMNETPHQWSSQLSTVPSVSEGGTDRGSRNWSDDLGRRSSNFHSSASHHSRQVLSISSSMTPEEAYSRPRSHSLEPPQPSYARNGQRYASGSSIIEDQDEYGDGLTDLRNMRRMPSRTRLSGFYSVSDNERSNTMRSTTSSRANSLLASTLPTWAKMYYGSGERRFLGVGAPGSSTEGSDSRSNSFRSGSPMTDHFPLSIYSPRRRPRDINTHRRGSNRSSMEITPAPQLASDGRLIQDPYSRRFRTWSMSSIWSPHLRRDRRADRHSIWDPPSVNWSSEGGCFGRRNVQVVMFIIGWIFPFAWMIAAFLPLPKNSLKEMRERDNSTGSFGPNDYTRQFGPMDEARYENARWWRNLNRWMSLVGLLIIAAIVILVIIGIREGW